MREPKPQAADCFSSSTFCILNFTTGKITYENPTATPYPALRASLASSREANTPL